MLTQEQLKALLHYNPSSGEFTRLTSAGGFNIGSKVGSFDALGYCRIRLNYKMYKAHRLAYLYMTGSNLSSAMEIDHIDGIGTNNKWTNLRLATRAQNNQNTKLSVLNTSGIKGVSFHKATGKWLSKIKVNGICLCKYHTKLEEATAWITTKRNKLHGEFANHGRVASSALIEIS